MALRFTPQAFSVLFVINCINVWSALSLTSGVQQTFRQRIKHAQPDVAYDSDCSFDRSKWKAKSQDWSAESHVLPRWRLNAKLVRHTPPLPKADAKTVATQDANTEGTTMAYAAAVFKPAINQSETDTTQIGYCINGLARTFTKPMVYKSFFQNLIPSYGGQATIFTVMVPAEEHSAAQAGAHTIAQMGTTASRLHALLKSLGIARFEIEAHDVPGRDIAAVAAKTRCQKITHDPLYPSFVSQLVHSQACWNEMTTYEDQVGMMFDKMVYSRPDVTWYGRVPHHTDASFYPLESPVSNEGGLDHAMFGTRAVMEVFFRRLDWHVENCTDHGKRLDASMGVADGLPIYFDDRGLEMRVGRMPCVIVRDNGAMLTAWQACHWQFEDFGTSPIMCLCAIYEGRSGEPRSDPSGLWW